MKEKYVFGLDIGTRSVVGTVGYRKGDKFIVVAQRMREHETRAMLDGQIHDIQKVGDTIREVKSELEDAIEEKLSGVCIAAAGRVLFTVNTTATIEIDNREVTQEDIYNLVSLGVEQAYEEFLSQNKSDEDTKFYCVGHSVVRYYLNGNQISNLEGHKARTIGVDLIATFLPDEVVDSLYKAVEIAGLKVDNLTLEPIAAIGLAIPERFRMLNIALVDVGAGTSDISITNDGCIMAFGMIPMAGDSLTEDIAKACLVDFREAEKIKKEADYKDEVEYMDIMLLPQKIKATEVADITKDTIDKMTGLVAEKIKELNGGKAVSAVFVVGGGGRMPGYSIALAEKLGIAKERVAIRGEEVMQNIVFEEEVNKTSLLVTPIGICLNYYEQSNNFIFVSFNGARIKLYNNDNLTIGDVALQAQFPKEGLFPKRGDALEFTVNGKAKMYRGEAGEAARMFINDVEANINSKVRENDIIRVIESTKGKCASAILDSIEEIKESIIVEVNGTNVKFPKFATVNGELVSTFYEIQTGDVIEALPYYTVKQIADFMDIIIDPAANIYVNNKLAAYDTKVYDNFALSWVLNQNDSKQKADSEDDYDSYDEENYDSDEYTDEVASEYTSADSGDETVENATVEDATVENASAENASVEENGTADKSREAATNTKKENAEKTKDTKKEKVEASTKANKKTNTITVIVNKAPVTLSTKLSYVFVDVFDAINFNLSDSKGRAIVTRLNGRNAQYMENLKDGDIVDIYWEE